MRSRKKLVKLNLPSRAFTLVEVLIVIALVLLLVALVVPALRSVRKEAKRVVCGSNLRQVGLSLEMYAGDNGDMFPPRPNGLPVYEKELVMLLGPYVDGRVLRCPSAPATSIELYPMDYGFNWDTFAGRARTQPAVLGSARYFGYMFDEWRVDEGSRSYGWHYPRRTIGVDNISNVLYPDVSVSREVGWDRYRWQVNDYDWSGGTER